MQNLLHKLARPSLTLSANNYALDSGAMKRGQGRCGTFKAFNLTYLHVVLVGMFLLPVSKVRELGKRSIRQARLKHHLQP